MSEAIAKHQLFEYQENEPFIVLEAKDYPPEYRNQMPPDADEYMGLNHWHEELELAYIVNSRSRHYIDGVCVEGVPGRLVVTNSESAHNVIRDNACVKEECLAAIIILIHAQFLREQFPQYQSIYFTNEKEQAREEISDIIMKLHAYMKRQEKNPHDVLYAKGLILQLLYYMCEEGTARRDEVDVNVQKNIERLKGVLTYIQNHYMEPISQAEVAKKFYFNKEYFSRYFKRCMGMNFTTYLVHYRLQKAKQALLETDKRITDIALEHGFSDDRGFINAFKKIYGTTPLQYRKSVKNTPKTI